MRELTFDEMDMVSGGYGGAGSTEELTVRGVTSNAAYAGQVVNCMKANWSQDLMSNIIIGGKNGALAGFFVGTMATGVTGPEGAVAGLVIGATAGAVTSIVDTAIVCAIAPNGFHIGPNK
jgi:F0F1-type ATP synthase assembly protein I